MCSSTIMDISDHKSYNLGENKIEGKTPVHFEIKNEDDQGPKCTFFSSLIWEGWRAERGLKNSVFSLAVNMDRINSTLLSLTVWIQKLCYCTQVKPCMMMILTGITGINDIIVISSDHNTNDFPSTWQGIRDAHGSTSERKLRSWCCVLKTFTIFIS